jgi:hypothetical protein
MPSLDKNEKICYNVIKINSEGRNIDENVQKKG